MVRDKDRTIFDPAEVQDLKFKIARLSAHRSRLALNTLLEFIIHPRDSSVSKVITDEFVAIVGTWLRKSIEVAERLPEFQD